MNGAEHYREAARLAEIAARHITEDPRDMRIAEVSAYAAQAHATLALAAAQAMPTVASFCGDSTRITDWGAAIGWDTVPDRVELQARIDAALVAVDSDGIKEVADWHRGFRECAARARTALHEHTNWDGEEF